MRFLPYVVGGFMLLPFLIWGGLWTAFPGPKPGLTDSPIAAALVAVSLPLVMFHYIAGLGYAANSMAGRAGEALPVWGPARLVQRAMAPLTGALSLVAFVWLLNAGEGIGAAAAVAAAGLLMTAVMSAARRPTRLSVLLVRPSHWADTVAAGAGRAVLAVPFLGSMVAEARRDPHRGVPLLLLNLALGLAVAVGLFGFTVLVVPALLAVPVVFYALLALAAD